MESLIAPFLLSTQQTFLVFQDVFKTSSRRLQRNTFRLPRPLEDVFKTCLQDVLQLCLQDVFKTSWKTKKCYTEDVFKTPSRRLQYAFIKTNVCWARVLVNKFLFFSVYFMGTFTNTLKTVE